MRSMSRNRQTFYYASFLGKTMGLDADNNYTEAVITYSDPEQKEAVISEGSGEAVLQLFGMAEQYDKVITLNRGEDYLKVGSVLWIDTPISLDDNGHLEKDDGKIVTPFNYVVVAVRKPLNIVNVAVKKVKAS